MHQHSPLSFVNNLGAKLATKSRHVCFFFGAGVARACGLPDITQLEIRILEKLGQEDQQALQVELTGRNLEQALSRLRRISALIDDDQTIDNLTASRAKEVDAAVCDAITAVLDTNAANLVPVRNFAAWVKRADYHLPVEIFTVNYDLLVETGLEAARVPYFDGFVGALAAPFQIDLVEGGSESNSDWIPANFARLWKLHGSVNWAWRDREIVRLGQAVNGAAAAIYPSDMKYDESRRVPFVVLQDRFRRALNHRESLTLVSGYSFSDFDLNELIFDAAGRHERSEFVVFFYDDIPDRLAEPAMTTPNIQVIAPTEAIIGGVRGTWKPPEQTSLPNLWGNGKLLLSDFSNLAAYLSRSISGNNERADDVGTSTT